MPDDASKLISLMFVIGRKLREEMKQSLQKNGSSWLHFEVLRFVSDNKRTLMRNVAEHFSITPPAATLLVDGLVAGKLLRRIVDPKDRRAVRVAITPKGKQILARGIAERIQKIRNIFSVLDVKENAELLRILGKIAKIQ